MAELNYSKIKDFKLPNYMEIPGVGLFLEQVSKYINECLEQLGLPDLTGSMISNYVKKDIIENPVKKQYSRDQIAYLMFIAIAKSVLSLEDITIILELQKKIFTPEEAYNFFRNEFTNILGAIFDGKASMLLGDIKFGSIDFASIANEINDENREESINVSKALSRSLFITAAFKIHLDMIFGEFKIDNK